MTNRNRRRNNTPQLSPQEKAERDVENELSKADKDFTINDEQFDKYIKNLQSLNGVSILYSELTEQTEQTEPDKIVFNHTELDIEYESKYSDTKELIKQLITLRDPNLDSYFPRLMYNMYVSLTQDDKKTYTPIKLFKDSIRETGFKYFIVIDDDIEKAMAFTKILEKRIDAVDIKSDYKDIYYNCFEKFYRLVLKSYYSQPFPYIGHRIKNVVNYAELNSNEDEDTIYELLKKLIKKNVEKFKETIGMNVAKLDMIQEIKERGKSYERNYINDNYALTTYDQDIIKKHKDTKPTIFFNFLKDSDYSDLKVPKLLSGENKDLYSIYEEPTVSNEEFTKNNERYTDFYNKYSKKLDKNYQEKRSITINEFNSLVKRLIKQENYKKQIRFFKEIKDFNDIYYESVFYDNIMNKKYSLIPSYERLRYFYDSNYNYSFFVPVVDGHVKQLNCNVINDAKFICNHLFVRKNTTGKMFLELIKKLLKSDENYITDSDQSSKYYPEFFNTYNTDLSCLAAIYVKRRFRDNPNEFIQIVPKILFNEFIEDVIKRFNLCEFSIIPYGVIEWEYENVTETGLAIDFCVKDTFYARNLRNSDNTGFITKYIGYLREDLDNLKDIIKNSKSKKKIYYRIFPGLMFGRNSEVINEYYSGKENIKEITRFISKELLENEDYYEYFKNCKVIPYFLNISDNLDITTEYSLNELYETIKQVQINGIIHHYDLPKLCSFHQQIIIIFLLSAEIKALNGDKDVELSYVEIDPENSRKIIEEQKVEKLDPNNRIKINIRDIVKAISITFDRGLYFNELYTLLLIILFERFNFRGISPDNDIKNIINKTYNFKDVECKDISGISYDSINNLKFALKNEKINTNLIPFYLFKAIYKFEDKFDLKYEDIKDIIKSDSFSQLSNHINAFSKFAFPMTRAMKHANCGKLFIRNERISTYIKNNYNSGYFDDIKNSYNNIIDFSKFDQTLKQIIHVVVIFRNISRSLKYGPIVFDLLNKLSNSSHFYEILDYMSDDLYIKHLKWNKLSNDIREAFQNIIRQTHINYLCSMRDNFKNKLFMLYNPGAFKPRERNETRKELDEYISYIESDNVKYIYPYVYSIETDTFLGFKGEEGEKGEKVIIENTEGDGVSISNVNSVKTYKKGEKYSHLELKRYTNDNYIKQFQIKSHFVKIPENEEIECYKYDNSSKSIIFLSSESIEKLLTIKVRHAFNPVNKQTNKRIIKMDFLKNITSNLTKVEPVKNRLLYNSGYYNDQYVWREIYNEIKGLIAIDEAMATCSDNYF